MRKVLPTAGAGALRQEHLGEEGARAVLERACGVSRAWMVPGQEDKVCWSCPVRRTEGGGSRADKQ